MKTGTNISAKGRNTAAITHNSVIDRLFTPPSSDCKSISYSIANISVAARRSLLSLVY